MASVRCLDVNLRSAHHNAEAQQDKETVPHCGWLVKPLVGGEKGLAHC